MTKEELIAEYCAQRGDANKNVLESMKYTDLMLKASKTGATQLTYQLTNTVNQYNEIAKCSLDNYSNAFRVLRKDYGIEKEEDLESICVEKFWKSKDK